MIRLVALEDNTNLVRLEGLANSTGAQVNNATASGTIYGADDSVLWTGSLVAEGTGGNYEGAIPHTTGLVAPTQYRTVVVADSGGLHFEAEVWVTVEKRRAA